MAASPWTANVGRALSLLRALRRHGLGGVVVCPGSRSAPLAMAASLLEPHGLLLRTAIDERSAAFFALGWSRGTGRPMAVITTSGTAVANLLPAVVEADHGTIALLVLTADRPARLKRCGANQSVNQEEFLRHSCRWMGEGSPLGLAQMSAAALEAMAERATAAALASDRCGAMAPPGPVHLNLPFDEPLQASAAELQVLADALVRERPGGGGRGPSPGPGAIAWPETPRRCAAWKGGDDAIQLLDPDRPGVVVAGPWRGSPGSWAGHVEALRRWQWRSGWPVLADVLSGLRGVAGLEVVAGYDLLLDHPAPSLAAGQVLRLGPLPASRRLQRWLGGLEGEQLLISEGDPRPLDPLGRAGAQWSDGLEAWLNRQSGSANQMTAADPGRPAPASLKLKRAWWQAERRIQGLMDRALSAADAPDGCSEPWLARALNRLLPSGIPVLLANSSPVRDWDHFTGVPDRCRPIHAFRGASGIDGTLSIACGLTAALGRLVLVSGDLALLHDSNGWLWHRQLGGRLTVVQIENGGGGIFEQLPIRTDPDAALDFERLFAMPQGVDGCILAAAHGVPSRRVERAADLAEALDWALEQPLALLSVTTHRRADAGLRQRLRTMAAQDPAAP